jgi:hypothetical protein
MNDLRAHERNLEEEWITKYRTALQAVPNRETWDARLRRIAFHAYDNAASGAQEMKTKILANKTVHRWMRIISSSAQSAVTSPRRAVAARTLQALSPRRSQSVSLQKRSAKKAG